MNTPPSGFAQYPRPQGLPSGVRPLPPGVHIEAIGEAFTLFQQDWQTWVLASFILCAICGAIVIPVLFINNLLTYGQLSFLNNRPSTFSLIGYAESQLLSIASGFIQMLMQCGLASMALKKLRGQSIGVGDVFGAFRFAPRLLGAYFCLYLIFIVTFIACCIPFLWSLGALVLTPLIIIDQDKGVFDAIGTSVKGVGGFVNAVCMTGMAFLLSLIGGAGAIACIVGVVATIPLAAIALVVQYYYFFPEQFAVAQAPSAPYPAG
jgi:hypothetical protein